MADSDEYYTPRDGTSVAKFLPHSVDVIETFNRYNIQMKNLRSILHQSTSQGEANVENFDVNNGISFLQLRIQTLLQYNLNLLQYLFLRGEARQIKNHPLVLRLAHLRLVLEMTKPIAVQLQSQINQILEKAVFDVKLEKPQVPDITSREDFIAQIPISKFSSQEYGPIDKITSGYRKNKMSYEEMKNSFQSGYENEDISSKNLEMPTKTPVTTLRGGQKRKLQSFDEVDEMVVSTKYSDDRNQSILANETLAMRQKEIKHNIREKASYSTLVRELREELSEKPIEQSVTGLSMHKLSSKEQKERRAFEEDNFTRIRENKTDRKRQKRLHELGGMDDIEDVADYSQLYNNIERNASKKRR